MPSEPKPSLLASPVASTPTVGRRDLLLGALALTVPLGGCVTEAGPAVAETPAPKGPFQHGVASGDPLPDAVVLWTRVKGEAAGPVEGKWEISEDPAFSKQVTGGAFSTSQERDFTVKVDARGLAPGRTYYYRFTALGATSPVGRTRTAPSGAVDRLRFAVVSCASFAHGYFHGYRALAKQADLDAVLHLGDYIYEYAAGDFGSVRVYEPANEILSLADYRTRHAQYKRDPDLQAVHRQHPFITIWDDHEIANDGWQDGAQNHNPVSEGSWAERKAAAKRAYMEWMPIREQDGGRIYRKLGYGDLVDLVMLDTRYEARSKQIGGAIAPPPPPDPTRTLLGDVQRDWMESTLKESKARWRLLGQQVMVGNLILDPGKSLANLDQWHGYPEARARLLKFLRESVKNVVVLTGDIHSSWANELTDDPNDKAAYDPETGRGSVGVEFVTPGITSPGIPDLFLGILDDARPKNPHVKWVNGSKRGFLVLDVTAERVQGAWHHFEDISLEAPQTPVFAKAWAVRTGETRLVSEERPAASREPAPALAP